MTLLLMKVPAKIILASCLLIASAVDVLAQTVKDTCHVYVVDVAKASRALDDFRETGNKEADAKALAVGQTIFPEFSPLVGEEELTTKHYPFPGSKLVITASVYYTDESMASQGQGEFVSHSESMLIGVTVSARAKPDAITASAGESAIAEVTYDQYTNKVRAKKYIRVNGRSYLVGIECDCMTERLSKQKAD
jgi:hypothetical protein